MKNKNTKKPQKDWYPVLREDLMLDVLRKEGILDILDGFIDKGIIEFIEMDVLAFVNRAIKSALKYNKDNYYCCEGLKKKTKSGKMK
jgi:hypothetical protein